jgi:hypothetical protein
MTKMLTPPSIKETAFEGPLKAARRTIAPSLARPRPARRPAPPTRPDAPNAAGPMTMQDDNDKRDVRLLSW